MINLLTDLVELFENIPDYILYAIETVINLVFSAINLALLAANELLGGLPEVITPPKYVSEINWYYPVGTLLAVVSPFIALYITWLSISWLYRKFGAI
jgi:uncharacterized membrane protein YdbT with pleckstrin-like domain